LQAFLPPFIHENRKYHRFFVFQMNIGQKMSIIVGYTMCRDRKKRFFFGKKGKFFNIFQKNRQISMCNVRN